MSLKKARIALVFDWMTTAGGAEKVNLKLHQMFPDAEIFCSIFNRNKISGFEKAKIHTSFIQKLPFAKTKHQYYLNLMPYAYELFDLSKFDIVISSSHACAKGVITKPETLHICYCHTPMRYAWDNWQQYFQEYNMNRIFKSFGQRKIHKIRIWDRLAAERVDYFIANSQICKRRIEKYYHKASTVINPPVDISKFQIAKSHQDYFLAIGRLTAYKKFDLLIDVFNEMDLKLKIIGTGVDENRLRQKAHTNIEFLGFVQDEELIKYYSESSALIFPQVEDFGLTAIESMASGRPVIALREGGAIDTILEGKTGIFFEKQTKSDLKKAIEKFLDSKRNFHPNEIRQHAENFSDQEFEKKLLNYLEEKWEHWQSTQ